MSEPHFANEKSESQETWLRSTSGYVVAPAGLAFSFHLYSISDAWFCAYWSGASKMLASRPKQRRPGNTANSTLHFCSVYLGSHPCFQTNSGELALTFSCITITKRALKMQVPKPPSRFSLNCLGVGPEYPYFIKVSAWFSQVSKLIPGFLGKGRAEESEQRFLGAGQEVKGPWARGPSGGKGRWELGRRSPQIP